MSLLYDYIKEKAHDNEIKNKIVYINDNKNYKDLLEDIDNQIVFLKESYDFQDNFCFLIVNNSYIDVLNFVALNHMGIRPIIINYQNLHDFYYETIYSDEVKNDITTVMPIKDFKIENDFSTEYYIQLRPEFYDDDGKYQRAHFIRVNYLQICDIINKYLKKNINMYNELQIEKYDFALLTSGTTGNNKAVMVKEDELIKRINSHYNLKDNRIFIGLSPLSAISGIIYNLYLPILGNDIMTDINGYLSGDECAKYSNVTMLMPGNFCIPPFDSKYLYNCRVKKTIEERFKKCLSFPIDKFVFLGDKANYDIVKKIRNDTKYGDKNVFSNCYGRTENLGLVSEIYEKNIVPIYVYYKALYNNKITFSFNKKDVYNLMLLNNERTISDSEISFNEDDFCEVIPIAIANKIGEDIKIKNGVFNEIIAEGKNTGDYGFELEGKIYLLCRENELAINDNKYIYASAFDKYYEKILNEKTIITRLTNSLVYQRCYFVVNENKHVNIYIPCRINYSRFNNYQKYFDIYQFLKEKELNDLIVDDIILVDRNDVTFGREVGKLKRRKLLELKRFNNYGNLLNNRSLDYKKIIGDIINRDDFEYYDNDFIFSKSNTSVTDIIEIVKKFKILDFRETNNNYYMVIDDSFLFGMSDLERQLKKDSKENYYKKYDNKMPLRQYIVENIRNQKCYMRVVIDDGRILTKLEPVYYENEYVINKKEKKDGMTIYTTIIDAEISSYYECFFGDKGYGIIYCIDDNNDFYLNDKKVDVSIYPNTGIETIYKNMIEIKSKIKSGGKRKCKTLI